MTSALAKPQRVGDQLEPLVAGLEPRPGRLDAGLLDVVGGAGAELGAEAPRELTLGEVEPAGQRGRPRGLRRGARRSTPAGRAADPRRRPGGRAGPRTATGRRGAARRRRASERSRARAPAPWSSSTSARARSIPAVTPAEVTNSPSRTKIGSASTSTSGKAAASASQYAQWVTARRPSSSPAAASTKDPEQTPAVRRAAPESRRTSASSGLVGDRGPRAAAAGNEQRVELSRSRPGERRRPSVRPLEVRTGSPESEAVVSE